MSRKSESIMARIAKKARQDKQAEKRREKLERKRKKKDESV